MSLDYKKMEDSFNSFVESEKGKKFLTDWFAREDQKKELAEKRFRRFEKYLETHDFDSLMYRLILEHGEDYCRKCYDNGYEPYPNCKLSFIIHYIFENTPAVEIKELQTIFTTEVHEFRGYYFEHMWGQGMGTHVYNKEDLKRLLTL